MWRIADIEGDEGMLPSDPKKNSATVAIQDYLDYIKADLRLQNMAEEIDAERKWVGQQRRERGSRGLCDQYAVR